MRVCPVHSRDHPCDVCNNQSAKPEGTFHLNTDRNVAVGEHYFIPMEGDENNPPCPKGVKVQLLGPGETATHGIWDGKDPQWLGYFPIPRKPKAKT